MASLSLYTKPVLRPRDRNDHYPTASAVVRAALDHLTGVMHESGFTPRTILDPGCGSGIWGTIAREVFPNVQIVGVDIQHFGPNRDYDVWLPGVDLALIPALVAAGRMPAPDLVLGNPPYGIAEACVRLCNAVLVEGGFIHFLLRQGFHASLERNEYTARKKKRSVGYCPPSTNGLFNDIPLGWFDTLVPRPSFTGDRKTDALEYALFTWRKGYRPARHSGGTLRWHETPRIPLDAPTRPQRCLPAPHPVVRP